MKTFATLILALMVSNSFGQTTYDKTVTTQFVNLYKKLPKHIRNEIDQIGNDSSREEGLAIFTEFKCDTLNKVEHKAHLPEIILIDPKTDKPYKSGTKKGKYPTLFCYGTLRNDSLVIQISGLFPDQVIMHFVRQKELSILYFEYYKNDYILKGNINDSLTNSLSVPVKISRFVLSDPAYKAGDIIYGSGDIITNSYFQKDSRSDNHFYKLRWHLKYYFKCKIVKSNK